MYTVSKLITNAYYLSGLVARDLESVSGSQLNNGLDLLNDFLGIKTADKRLIPYYNYFTITEVPGQELYFIPNLIDVVTATFNIGVVRFPMTRTQRRDYFGSARVDNINSLSFSYEVERVKGGSNIRVYFLPSANYPLNIMGKFGLMEVTDIGLDLEAIFDRFYIAYLRYGLANYICNEFNLTFPPEAAKELDYYEATIRDVSPIDFTINKFSYFTRTGGLSWGDVNIGKGYRPA